MRTLALAAVSLAAASLLAVETVKTPINNDDVRVLDVVVQPHEKTKMHDHQVNRVMIYRNAGAQAFEFKDGKASNLSFKANQVLWSPRAEMHIAEVSTADPVNIVEIELKKGGAGKTVTTALDPLKVDTKHYKLEFENDQVRVFRVKIGPHESTPMHEHQLNRVNVYLTDAATRVTAADGTVTTPAFKAGAIVSGGAAKHSETNTSDQPIEVIVTELKY